MVGVKRGDVVVANLDPTIGVEIKKTRPVIVLSNDSINQYSQLVVVVPFTKNTAHLSPSHAIIPKGVARLTFASKVVTEQIKAVDKRRLVKRLGSLTPALLAHRARPQKYSRLPLEHLIFYCQIENLRIETEMFRSCVWLHQSKIQNLW